MNNLKILILSQLYDKLCNIGDNTNKSLNDYSISITYEEKDKVDIICKYNIILVYYTTEHIIGYIIYMMIYSIKLQNIESIIF